MSSKFETLGYQPEPGKANDTMVITQIFSVGTSDGNESTRNDLQVPVGGDRYTVNVSPNGSEDFSANFRVSYRLNKI